MVQRLFQRITGYEVHVIAKMEMRHDRQPEIVERIRNHPDDFPSAAIVKEIHHLAEMRSGFRSEFRQRGEIAQHAKTRLYFLNPLVGFF